MGIDEGWLRRRFPIRSTPDGHEEVEFLRRPGRNGGTVVYAMDIEKMLAQLGAADLGDGSPEQMTQGLRALARASRSVGSDRSAPSDLPQEDEVVDKPLTQWLPIIDAWEEAGVLNENPPEPGPPTIERGRARRSSL